jgi:hypothetical protein
MQSRHASPFQERGTNPRFGLPSPRAPEDTSEDRRRDLHHSPQNPTDPTNNSGAHPTCFAGALLLCGNPTAYNATAVVKHTSISPAFCACEESAAVLFAKVFDVPRSVTTNRNCLSYGAVCDKANNTREKDSSGQCELRTHCQILLLETPTSTICRTEDRPHLLHAQTGYTLTSSCSIDDEVIK